jgi:hypothetical protein
METKKLYYITVWQQLRMKQCSLNFVLRYTTLTITYWNTVYMSTVTNMVMSKTFDKIRHI